MATDDDFGCCPLPSTIRHDQWMADLPENLHNEPITKIAIPGSHDSFAYCLTSEPGPDLDSTLRSVCPLIYPIIRNWSVTQNQNFIEQLKMGIRYFDLRVCPTQEKKLCSRSPFQFTHGLLGLLVRDGLEEMNQFLNQHPKEIILLDFNHFYGFTDQCGHDQLIHLIHEVFGNKLCTTARSITDCTLNYLWNNKQQVILLYERHVDECRTYIDRVGHFFQVCQSPWPNTSSVDDLFAFITERVSQSRPINCINVVQVQVTPNSSTIQSSPLGSLASVAKTVNSRLFDWLIDRTRDPSLVNGVNVVICDFINQGFTDAIIQLNYKS